MIRKQLYITESHDRILKELATQWNCTEAEVVRKALDRLPPAAETWEERVVRAVEEAGLLVKVTPSPDLPREPEERERLRQQLEQELRKRTEPLGLSGAVLEDRR